MDNFLLLPRAIAAALSDATFAGAFGLVLASLLLGHRNEFKLRISLRSTTFCCLITMLLSGLAQVYLTTATMVGVADIAVVRSQITTVAWQTHAGKALMGNLVAVVVLILMICIARNLTRRSTAWTLLFGLLVDAVFRAGSGHAAADGDFKLPEFIQYSHLISIAIWAGCVLAGGFVVIPFMLKEQRVEDTAAFTRRLSQTVTFALAIVLLSGAYNSYRGSGGALRPLIGSQWGILLDVKLFLVVFAIALGRASRQIITNKQVLSIKETSKLAMLVRVEAFIMVLILTVSAWLANSPPASSG